MTKAVPTLITGATGFVGNTLVGALQAQERAVRRALHRPVANPQPGDVVVGDIGPDTDWSTALAGVDCVVHLAARTHVLDERSVDPTVAYRRVNVEATRHLAQQAAAASVRRFVFLSSVKVNGESTTGCGPFNDDDPPRPENPYGISKREAEDQLRAIARATSMEVVILRSPLVYGPGVKGNLLSLLRLIDRGMPLPLASVDNRRSLLYVGNLVDAIITCMDAPAAANKTWLVSDGEDVSTPDLIRRLAVAMGKPARLWPCPVGLLRSGAALLGRSALAARLTGSLVIDSSRIRQELGWCPRYTLDQGLIETARWYHQFQHY